MAYLENGGISNSTTIYSSGSNEYIGMAFWNHDGSKIIVHGGLGRNHVI